MPGKNSSSSRFRLRPLLAPALLVLLAPSCLVDLDDRCGPHQEYDQDIARCVCQADHALVGNDCVACGDNEVSSPDGCVCLPGFLRSEEDGPCQEAASLGQACGNDADCSEEYPYCRQASADEDGYCTLRDCASSDECPTDYSCNTREEVAFCEQPPVGLGTSCHDDADCAEFEAPFCETVVSQACVVNDCKPNPDKCYGDWVCCDIALLGQSLCVPPTELTEGECPAGGTLIPGGE